MAYDSDKSLKIDVVVDSSTADPAAEQATAAIEQIEAAANKANESIAKMGSLAGRGAELNSGFGDQFKDFIGTAAEAPDEAVQKLRAADSSVKELEHSHTRLHAAMRAVHQLSPELGAALHAALLGPLGAIIVANEAISLFTEHMAKLDEEGKKAAERAYDVEKAWAEAAATINKSNLDAHYQALITNEQSLTKAVQTRLDTFKRLQNAQLEINHADTAAKIARLDELETAGKISPTQAILKRDKLRNAAAQADRENKAAQDQAELAAKNKELTDANIRRFTAQETIDKLAPGEQARLAGITGADALRTKAGTGEGSLSQQINDLEEALNNRLKFGGSGLFPGLKGVFEDSAEELETKIKLAKNEQTLARAELAKLQNAAADQAELEAARAAHGRAQADIDRTRPEDRTARLNIGINTATSAAVEAQRLAEQHAADYKKAIEILTTALKTSSTANRQIIDDLVRAHLITQADVHRITRQLAAGRNK